jgi:hypothetical protein
MEAEAEAPDGGPYGGFPAGSMTAVVATLLGRLDDAGEAVDGSGTLSVLRSSVEQIRI